MYIAIMRIPSTERSRFCLLVKMYQILHCFVGVKRMGWDPVPSKVPGYQPYSTVCVSLNVPSPEHCMSRISRIKLFGPDTPVEHLKCEAGRGKISHAASHLVFVCCFPQLHEAINIMGIHLIFNGELSPFFNLLAPVFTMRFEVEVVVKWWP